MSRKNEEWKTTEKATFDYYCDECGLLVLHGEPYRRRYDYTLRKVVRECCVCAGLKTVDTTEERIERLEAMLRYVIGERKA
jgi:hypothetical protein